MQSKIEKLREDYKDESGKIIYGIDDYHKYLENKILKNDEINFKRFMRLQKEEIEKYKWCESERKGYDVGNECCYDWISKYAKDFAKKYWDD